MAIKKSELYTSLWKSCDELRGGMDASQYKDYVLVLLFVKYVSDKYAGQPDALIEVPEGGSFKDMVALKNKKTIGDEINKIIGKLAEANDLKGVIDVADFNDDDQLGKGNDMVDRLTNLVAIFENTGLDFSRNRAEGDDILGDAYEYLMRHFATESGKSKGQFYTPAEVSKVVSKLIGVHDAISPSQTIYDPTCGSGSLLIKAHDEAPYDLTIYGQDISNSNTALAKMNMILHNCPTAEIWNDNTLSKPYFLNQDGSLKTFDFVVANPPFSYKAWRNGLNPAKDTFKRFEDGIPPAKSGDYAFLLHILKSLKSTGKGAVILPHGVLFRGNSEAEIRKNIIRKGYIKGIIGLPPNLFYGTGIPACIIVLDKEYATARKGIFMIDASKGFMKDGSKNRLRHQDIHKIVDVFTKQIEIDKYSRMVSVAEIENNEYNLNIPRYIDSTEPEDLQDIEAHLKGGIPNRDIEALNAYWQVCPSLKDILFGSADREGYSQLKLEPVKVKPTISTHPEFVTFTESINDHLDTWKIKHIDHLKNLMINDRPKEIIEITSEDLLATFADVKLINSYDVYQNLMTYWSDTMQDDMFMITSDGWLKANKLKLIVEEKGKKNKEKADLVIGKEKYKAELIPPSILVSCYFEKDKEIIEKMETDLEIVKQHMEELKDEHGGEEGLLDDVIDDKGKISKDAVTDQLKKSKGNPEAIDEIKVLKDYLNLLENESKINKKIKEAQKALDIKLVAKYSRLTEEEIKAFVVEEKWLAKMEEDMQHELDRVSQILAGRIMQLAERYGIPIPLLTNEVEALSIIVDEHLRKMGFIWN